MPAEDLDPAIELFRHRRPSTSTPWSPSNHPGWRSRNGSPTKNPISIDSTVLGNHPIPIPTDSTKVPHGNPRKSNSTTAAPWFSNPPEKGARASRLFSNPKNRHQMKSWQSGSEGHARGE
jgi:hypothetical protein